MCIAHLLYIIYILYIIYLQYLEGGMGIFRIEEYKFWIYEIVFVILFGELDVKLLYPNQGRNVSNQRQFT